MIRRPRLSIVIPAAGASQRLGQPKQLVNFKGKSLIRQAIENAESLSPHEILVVTGADTEAVQAEVQKTTAKPVYNPDWSSGMGTSIACGARAVDDASDGLMILLCDQWRILPEDLHLLFETWLCNTQRIVCAATGSRCGPPVIFPSTLFQALSTLDGDHGAHSILRSHPDLVIPADLQNASSDLDTPSQLKELKEALTAHDP